jgi:selenocysteine lyase/cysteine desulfurase
MEAERSAAFAELERGIQKALETYANVHRGSGPNSLVSTALFEQARGIVLNCLGINDVRHVVIFCTPRSAMRLREKIPPGGCRVLSSEEIGLPIGVRALAVERRSLPEGSPIQSGGGTVRIVSPNTVVWAGAPEKFEAGTPAIVNVIAFAKALQIMRTFGSGVFRTEGESTLTAAEIMHDDEVSSCTGLELLLKLRKTVVGQDALVPTAEGARPGTNLDNGASTLTFSSIWDVVRRTWKQPKQVRRELTARVKEICSGFLGAPQNEYDVVFTGNATEAINLVAQSLGNSEMCGQTVVLNTLLEHNSDELPWRSIPGATLLRVPVDEEGFVDLRRLEELLREYNEEEAHGKQRIRLVAVGGASNVLGTCNDVQEISRIAHLYGAHILVDAAQLVAHRQIEMTSSGIDYLAFSAHKMYAPFGSGGLVVRKGLLDLDPVELAAIRESGEENTVGVAALGKAMLLLRRIGLGVIEEEERTLTLRAINGLSQIPGVTVYGVKDPMSPRFRRRIGIISFGLQNVPHNLVAKELAERGGIGVRTGCFCAHLLVKRLLKIHPLRARAADLALVLFPRLTSLILPGLVRISLGLENDENDVDHLIRTLSIIALFPRTAADRLCAWAHNATPFLGHTETQARMSEFGEAVMRTVYALPPEREAAFRREVDHLLKKTRRKFCCCPLKA